jgi:hypothetical protein
VTLGALAQPINLHFFLARVRNSTGPTTARICVLHVRVLDFFVGEGGGRGDTGDGGGGRATVVHAVARGGGCTTATPGGRLASVVAAKPVGRG